MCVCVCVLFSAFRLELFLQVRAPSRDVFLSSRGSRPSVIGYALYPKYTRTLIAFIGSSAPVGVFSAASHGCSVRWLVAASKVLLVGLVQRGGGPAEVGTCSQPVRASMRPVGIGVSGCRSSRTLGRS